MARINRGLVLSSTSTEIYAVPSGETLRITMLQVANAQDLNEPSAEVSVVWNDGANDYNLIAGLSIPPRSVADLTAGELSLEGGHTISASATASNDIHITLAGELE